MTRIVMNNQKKSAFFAGIYNSKFHKVLLFIVLIFFIGQSFAQNSLAENAPNINANSINTLYKLQQPLFNKPIGDKIVFWAESFIDVPYDTDPKGVYVTNKVIVYDKAVDCMYLLFRCVELAFSNSPREAVQIALNQRFITHGVTIYKKNSSLQNFDYLVTNYEQRFQYGEDMIASKKWGGNISQQLGKNIKIKGSRYYDYFPVLLTAELQKNLNKLKNGDLIFFIKAQDKCSKAQEIVGHMGVIAIENHQPYLIHASGTKGKGGKVQKVLLSSYLQEMHFIGVQITRF